MADHKLDFTYFYPTVYQAVAGKDFFVFAYLNDGSIRKFDVKPLIKQGGIFTQIAQEKPFKEKLTVLNGTVAWDIGGGRNEYQCIDIDPFDIFDSPVVPDDPDEDELAP